MPSLRCNLPPTGLPRAKPLSRCPLPGPARAMMGPKTPINRKPATMSTISTNRSSKTPTQVRAKGAAMAAEESRPKTRPRNSPPWKPVISSLKPTRMHHRKAASAAAPGLSPMKSSLAPKTGRPRSMRRAISTTLRMKTSSVPTASPIASPMPRESRRQGRCLSRLPLSMTTRNSPTARPPRLRMVCSSAPWPPQMWTGIH